MKNCDPLKILQDAIRRNGGQKTAAQELGVSTSYLNDVLKGRRDMGPRMLDALGIEKVVTYRIAS